MPRSRRPLAVALTLGLLAALAPADGVGAAAPSTIGTTRRVGDSTDVVAASVDISRADWADAKATRVVLARDDVFSDSLAGSALAATDGPVLFTTGGATAPIRPEVLAEIRRVLPAPSGCHDGADEVDVLGGTAAVSTAATKALADSGFCVVRIGGQTRIETATMIAARARDASEVLLARADTWPDSATAGAYAAATGHPIVVTPTNVLAPAVADLLDAVRPQRVVIVGGTAAVATSVADAASRYAPITRVAGTTRDGTAAAVATNLSAATKPTGVSLLDGWAPTGWAYAIAGGVDAARSHTVELLVQSGALPAATRTYLDAADDAFTVAVGPASSVSDDVVRQVETTRAWHHLAPPGAAPLRYRDAVFSDVTKTADLIYGSAVNRSGTTVTLRFDLYEPTGDDAVGRPLIIWVHGGGFSSGDKDSPELVDEATTFARKGYVNASITYRLEPQGCSAAAPTSACVDAINEATQDAQTAVRFLRANASTYGIDPTRIAIGGSSAGAITALDVGYDSTELPSSAVQAVVSLSGANILGTITPGDAPALLLHGSDDHIVPYDWAVSTVDAARKAGVVTDFTTWPGAGHVPYVQFRDEILDQTRDFLWWMLDLAAIS